jgi:Uma2 family endonuclease
VISAPFQMRLLTPPRGREPDLLFVAREHRDRLKETYLEGPADLVVEIVSPESWLRDRGEKFAEYEMAGVHEYWLLDPERRRSDWYRLDAEGRFRLSEPDAEGIYRSEVIPGFWLRVEWLWQEPLPPVLEILRALGVV